MERQQKAKLTKTNSTSRNDLQGKIAPQKPTASHPILQLQRKIGNQAVHRLLTSGGIQAKLQISQPGDAYEREADRVADQVMRMPEPRAQWKCSACEAGATPCPNCGEKGPIAQHKADYRNNATGNSVPDGSLQNLGSGRKLDTATHAFFEPRFGRDFSQVRVHTDARVANMAKSLNAKAFTIGHNIAFGAGEYQPGTMTGKKLLAHELMHGIQQRNATAKSAGAASLSVSPVLQCLRTADLLVGKPVLANKEGDKKENCGPGTHDPFCLGLPGPNEPCKPFLNAVEAQAQWDYLSNVVPLLTSAVTRCGDVKDVWDAYFAGNSKRFAFSSGCVVDAAKTDELASRLQETAAALLTNDILVNLPVTLRDVAPNPFSLGGPIAEIRMPLEEAIGTGSRQKHHLHPTIIYNTVSNAAANIAGDIGTSDVFGDDDRVTSGTVVIQVDNIDPTTGAMSGQIRWVPHVRAIDTVDFCPGNLGTSEQQKYTVPMSKLEAMGMTKDVPLTIDYDLGLQAKQFKDVRPLIGPLPPRPKPGPNPPKNEFPKSGPAKTIGSLLRIRTGPSLKATVLGLLGDRGTTINVETQVKGDPVDGNDVWDKIDRGFVSHRFVVFV